MSSKKNDTPVSLVPFQQEDLSTNQQNIPLPVFGGERLVAVRWISPALDEMTKQAQGSGKKG